MARRRLRAATMQLTEMLVDKLGKRGITCVVLRPGWVRTELGGPNADIDAPESISGMREPISKLTLQDGGRFLAWTGDDMPYQSESADSVN